MTTSNTTHTPSSPSGATRQIHVMLVDDSAVIRGGLSRIIEKDPAIKIVASVSNGEMGVSSAKNKQPHIAILDIEMPVMDGLTALPKVLEASPKTKVIMFSSLTEKGAATTLKAMSLGAVECLVKPSSAQGASEGSEFQRNLLALLKNLVPERERIAADPADIVAKAPPVIKPTDAPKLLKDSLAYNGKPSILAIGSSTGGPQALFNVLKDLKGIDIPVVITQHMPATFTKILAEHIQQQTGIPAHEGQDGMRIQNGHVYVAPGGFHMLIRQKDAQLQIKLDDGPQVNFCKPAVDPMFNSVVEIFGRKVLGVILTGMGNDGLGGGKTLTAAHGRLIAQDEASSVVWGMPGAVARAGLCNEILPLDKIGPWLRQEIMK